MIKIELIGDWKQAWKYYSMWFYVIIGAIPTFFNKAIEIGLFTSAEVSDGLNWTIKAIALLGAISRVIKQGVATAQEAAEAAQKESS